MYSACCDALIDLHGEKGAHPILSEPITGKISKRAERLLASLGVYSIQHLADYDTLDLIADTQTHYLYDDLVGVEIAKLKRKYKKYYRPTE